MNTQPVPITRQQITELRAKQKRAEWHSDALYVAGAVLVAAGVGCIRSYLALIALGVFCLVFPSLQLVTSFIRGLRRLPAARR
jgi:hypothetical protein